MSQGQTVSEAALFNLHTGVLQHTPVLARHESIKGRTPARPQANISRSKAMVIMDHRPRSRSWTRKISLPWGESAEQHRFSKASCSSAGRYCKTSRIKNQTGRRKLEMTYVRNAHVCVQGAKASRATAIRCASRSQPTRRRLLSPKAAKAESHAVAAAQIHHRSRSQAFGGKQAEDPIQPQLPADKPAVGPCASGKRPIHKANARPAVPDWRAP